MSGSHPTTPLSVCWICQVRQTSRRIAVAVPIAASHAMPLLQVTGARRRGDLAETQAVDILEHPVGDEGGQVRLARAEVHVEPAVVVEVAVVGPHGREDHV
jgi:hypothetical protein